MSAIVYDSFAKGLDLRKSAPLSVSDALRKLRNCYITTGKAVRKRPCLRHFYTLEPGTKGLASAGGKLHTFYGSGTVAHANPLFVAHLVAPPSGSSTIIKVHFVTVFNNFIYCSIEYGDGVVKHHYLDGTSPTYIVDTNCPHSKIVEKILEKIYSAAGPNVRFCATADPRDWTSVDDAGFIPAGISAAGSDAVTAIGDYQGKLAIFFSDSTQVWNVNSDPQLNAIASTSENIGTLHSKSPQPFANDLVFLTKQGFRSVSLAVLTDNLQENDIGSPIDALRDEIVLGDDPFAVYYPTLGQLWEINNAKAYVLTYSKSAKITAWATFDFFHNIDAAAVLQGELYIRMGDYVMKVDRSFYVDELIGGDGAAPMCEVDLYYQDAKAPGALKMWTGFDAVVSGSAQVSFKFDPRNESLVTEPLDIESDTRPGDVSPVELCSTSLAPRLTHQLNEEFQLDLMQIYFEQLGYI